MVLSQAEYVFLVLLYIFMVSYLFSFCGLEIANASLQAASKFSAEMYAKISLAGAQAYSTVAG